MNHVLGGIFALFLAIGGNFVDGSGFAQTVDEADVLLEVPVQPTWVKVNQQSHILYELHVTNIGKTSLELIHVDVFANQAMQTPIASFGKEKLEQWLKRPGLANDLPDKRSLNGGYRAIVFLNVVVPQTRLPRQLFHRLIFRTATQQEIRVTGKPVFVRPDPALVLSPPLHGDGWVAMNSLGSASHHRLSFLSLQGKAVVPQRYAIDWVKLGGDGKIHRNNSGENKSYYGYGAKAVAVANATVEETKDGLPEPAPFDANKASTVSFENSTGNHVILNLGNGRFALYAHLQPGSICVRKGERVRIGQVLGLLGSSGMSDIPHLHFQVMNTAHPMLADGLPYVFASFTVQGNVGSLEAMFDGKGITTQSHRSLTRRKKELPENLDVIHFR